MRLQEDGLDAPGHLTAWWSEARCARYFGDLVRPDAYGRWRQADREVEFFLEFDFGTEALPVLASKLAGYHQLACRCRKPHPFWSGGMVVLV